MRIDTWMPIYRRIADDFGFEPSADERARDRLVELVGSDRIDRQQFRNVTVAIAGAAPALEDDYQRVEQAELVIAASDAGSRLDDLGIEPDLVVTDLDGAPERTVALAQRGVPIAVHAHGDNIAVLERYVPELPADRVLGTTQVRPVEPLCNPGGFTDGDRAAFLADAFGADRLVFAGWDFDDPDVDPIKRQKLAWAQRLLYWLERDRYEQFDVLDGRREAIDLSPLRVE
jgi:hypothetical protein